MSTDDRVADAHAPAAVPGPQRWRPWWVVGTPGQLVWTCLTACVWTSIAIANAVTRHRPGDYWYLGVVALLWVVFVANVIAFAVRRDLLLLPPRPKSGVGRALFVTGTALCTAGAAAPILLLNSRPALAMAIAAGGIGLGAVLLVASRRFGPGGDYQDAATAAERQSA